MCIPTVKPAAVDCVAADIGFAGEQISVGVIDACDNTIFLNHNRDALCKDKAVIGHIDIRRSGPELRRRFFLRPRRPRQQS